MTAHTYTSKQCGFVSQTRITVTGCVEDIKEQHLAYLTLLAQLTELSDFEEDKLSAKSIHLINDSQLKIEHNSTTIILNIRGLDTPTSSDGGGSYNNAINEAKLINLANKKGLIKDLNKKIKLPIIHSEQKKESFLKLHKHLKALKITISAGTPRKAFILSNKLLKTYLKKQANSSNANEKIRTPLIKILKNLTTDDTPYKTWTTQKLAYACLDSAQKLKYINIHNKEAKEDDPISIDNPSSDNSVVNNMPLDTDLSFISSTTSFRIGSNQILELELKQNKSVVKAVKEAKRLYLNLREVNRILGNKKSSTPGTSIKDFIETFSPQELVVTNGEQGAFFATNGTITEIKNPENPKEKAKELLSSSFYTSGDPTGCGDCLAPCMEFYESIFPEKTKIEALIFASFMASTSMYYTQGSNYLNLDDTILETVFDAAVIYAQKQ